MKKLLLGNHGIDLMVALTVSLTIILVIIGFVLAVAAYIALSIRKKIKDKKYYSNDDWYKGDFTKNVKHILIIFLITIILFITGCNNCERKLYAYLYGDKDCDVKFYIKNKFEIDIYCKFETKKSWLRRKKQMTLF